MSIPGLGQIAPTAAPSATTASAASPTTETHTLQPFWEYRFEVPHGSTLTIKLISGTAEKDGTELAPSTPYSFSATKSKINTWHGCVLEVTTADPVSGASSTAAAAGSSNGNISGSNNNAYDAYIAEPASPDETCLVSYLNLHFKLEGMRSAAAAAQKASRQQQQQQTTSTSAAATTGPRVMVVGPPSAGKSTLVRTLAGWATRMGRQPLAVNTDPREGMLALPGTLSAAVLATIADVTNDGGVAGSTPMSGPSAVPVKLPLAYYYGLASPDANPRLYRSVCSALAAAATARLTRDPEDADPDVDPDADVRAAGLLIDTPGVLPAADDRAGYEHLAHVAAEFSANIIVVLGSERVAAEMVRRFVSAPGQRTTLGEPVAVVALDRSGGVVERDAAFMQAVRERAIREYFFGDKRSTLSPFTQQVDFDALSVWRVNEAPSSSTSSLSAAAAAAANDDDSYDPDMTTMPFSNPIATPDIERVEPSQLMQNCTLAVVYAEPNDAADAVRDANVMGFVYVADVDEKRRRLRVLAPVSARLGDRPLLWGQWPEPMVSLLG
ncbi:Cleavage polyadenylation factor subunit clp1 [Diatrype stigma]|uniref:Polynucleotide 5'-hydroxyl-kinase GRC3 n=1 Tax=Diatrype stigma TaxID=117547 RepID=A0AAN9YQW5_9PEZI